MSIRLPAVLLVALGSAVLAACAPESHSPTTAIAAEQGIDGGTSPGATLGGASTAPMRLGRAEAAIAGYPDRGDLVGYDAVRPAQRRGAHTFHPVRVSEAHALDAIATGTLHVTGPDGRRVSLRYERHVEHPSGDWSWIGRDERGVDAILTFGEKAVFGVLPSGDGDTLRLTTNAGQTWMSTTAEGVLSPLQQRIRGGLVEPDYRVPPALPEADGLRAAAAPASQLAAAAAVQPAATTTVDVFLGYTPGFASMLGGASQAQTRLNHIVTVGNQTFANSSVDVRFRLVGTLQVNYPDTGNNEAALEQLTGSDGESNVAVPASLVPLRNARETYGADLVSLVRRFRDADHEGCGIAWLIGGGQTPIQSGHERFGYSVISDSNGMQAPDNGHFCRDETLVHEMGHNLGSQHDVEAARGEDGNLDAGDYGRYPYSFGLKTGATNGNFHTVMAYGDEGQTAYRVFSNPQSTFCGGRACGIANQADNARSLRSTAPLIAAFRASRGGGGARADFDGDGVSDLLWRKSNDGRNAIWLRANSATQPGVLTVLAPWQIVGVGDFDGDRAADIVWRHGTSGRNVIWRSGNGNATIGVATVDRLSWQVAGAGDFDGDGRADLLWRDALSGRNAIWLSGNAATQLSVLNVPDRAWRIVGVGDIDGDGVADIVWRHAGNGRNLAWRGGNGNSTITLSTVTDASWQVAAVDDFNGDGRADLFWHHAASGRNALWLSGNSGTQLPVPTVERPWRVEGSGDFDGDGTADVVWRNPATGVNIIWLAANANDTLHPSTVADPAWDIVP